MRPRILHLSIAVVVFFVLLNCFAPAQQPVVRSRILEPVDETKLTQLKGNTHRLARPEFDRGPAPPELPMDRMLLVLKRGPEQEAALQKLLDDQQDKASSSYHKWLTPEQLGSRFGPNDKDVQAVTSWLQSHGFQIAKVAKGRNIIEFSGTASQVQATLHTAIHKYVVNGEEHWANANDPAIPSALTPVVAGVLTLHNFVKKPMLHMLDQKIPAKLVSQGAGKPPKVTFPGNPPVHGLGPADYAKIYNINVNESSYGQGVTIAVVARSNLFSQGQDIFNFGETFTSMQPKPNIILNGPDPGDIGGGEEAEATLDATWSSAAEPLATVDFVVSAITNTTDGVDLSEEYIVDNNLADIMTESFGGCEAAQLGSTEIEFVTSLAAQAAAQGITYFVSSGDSGAEGCDNPDVEVVATGPVSVSLSAATPFNVAVGGTMFNENGQDSKYWSSSNAQNTFESALSYIPENVWNQSCTQAQCGQNANIVAGGGGASGIFKKPSWQSGVAGIPPDGARDVPDVSLTASLHDPYLLCLEGSCVPDTQGNFFFAAVGGTSASAPSFAGMMALVDQKMNGRQGLANYVLYKLAAQEYPPNSKSNQCNASNTSGLPASTCVFNDVTVGNNEVPGEVSLGVAYPATVGYDLATGLGSVNVANLVNKWSSVTFSASKTAITITSPASPVTVTHGSPVSLDLTVTANGGTPTGNVAVIANSGASVSQKTGIGSFALTSGSATPSINSLPGGTYTLSAQYSGDGTFAPSTSSSPGPSITVNSETSNTKLSALTFDPNFNFIPFAGGPYGSFVYLRADVAGSSGQGTATGNVNFMDSGNSLGSFALNTEGNTATPNFGNAPNGGTPTGLFTLTVGSHSITANYGGDASFQPSTSSAVNLNITQAPTTTTLSSAAAAKGTTFTATINTSSGGTPPSGTIAFSISGTQVGSPITVAQVPALTSQTGSLQGAQATATLPDTSLANGTYTVKASYSGDPNYVASSGTASVTQQNDFAISAGSNAAVNIPAPGQSGSLTLTITALDGYSGTINFAASSCSGLPTGASCAFSPASVKGGGTTVVTVSTTAAAAYLRHPGRRSTWWLASLGTGIAASFLLIGPCKGRSKNLLGLLVCAFLVTGVGCGGGGSSNNTPPPPPASTPAGTSNVVVTATSGTLTHNATFTLNVQ
ncbi:MAG: Ig-like domain repeat protein [Acidobacteriaceae bacterium]|nr:Ig-like domain repeat protein [Acidobacteriaceae bacterium]